MYFTILIAQKPHCTLCNGQISSFGYNINITARYSSRNSIMMSFRDN